MNGRCFHFNIDNDMLTALLKEALSCVNLHLSENAARLLRFGDSARTMPKID